LQTQRVMTSNTKQNQVLGVAARPKTGRQGWLLWSSVVTSGTLAGCAVSSDDTSPPPPTSSITARRIDRIELPRWEAGADLDDDGDIDNRAAMLLSAVFRSYEDAAEQWRAAVEARLTELDWTIETRIDDGRVALADDVVGLPLGALADLAGVGVDAGWIDAVDARVTARFEPDGGVDLVLAGALPDGYAPVVAEAFLPFINSKLAEGDTVWGAQADANDDGALTTDELLGDRLFQALLAPDLPDGALSFAFGVHAR
jgi:hypothetical protein